MEKLICTLKDMTDFFSPNYYELFNGNKNKTSEDRYLQNVFYILEHIQDMDFDLDWHNENYFPCSGNYFEYLSLYEEVKKQSLSITNNERYITKLQKLKDSFNSWLKENIPDSIPLPNALYAITLLHFMRYTIRPYENHKDKMIIKAQQFCFLEEADLKRLWTVTDNMRPNSEKAKKAS